MQDYGIIKAIIDLIEAEPTTAFLKQKVVTQGHYGLAEPYVCLNVLECSTDRPLNATRAKVMISVEVISKYKGIFEITQIMNLLQGVLSHKGIINVHGEAMLEIEDSKIKMDMDGQRRIGTQTYMARFNLHGRVQ